MSAIEGASTSGPDRSHHVRPIGRRPFFMAECQTAVSSWFLKAARNDATPQNRVGAKTHAYAGSEDFRRSSPISKKLVKHRRLDLVLFIRHSCVCADSDSRSAEQTRAIPPSLRHSWRGSGRERSHGNKALKGEPAEGNGKRQRWRNPARSNHSDELRSADQCNAWD